MHTITFISTVHERLGKCDSSELFAILAEIKPDVIFLEALESTYSSYHQNTFTNFGVYHPKLEIAAIQKLSKKFPVKYVPVLKSVLPDSFLTKYKKLNEFNSLQRLFDDYNSNIEERGFAFLNSKECSDQNEKMREIERHLLNNNELEKLVNEGIDAYESSMMRNIYLYCRNNQFDTGVFMCGVAHRNSIIDKMENYNTKEQLNLNWKIYGN
ncbi:hypothetical protein ACJRPK_12065 [Aquimarina sp. 2-A2]|uniref:hypothetical protein n=1 Tax=Aquimarina sp. 2-A2 TaxID=3382644 RepID=UPI00387F2064